MKYFKFFFRKFINFFKRFSGTFICLIIALGVPILTILEIYIEDEEINLNPFDYCNITDVDYTAILHDDPNKKANVEITEYLTFDIHAASKDNPFKEIWRELPESTVDGLKVTYDVKSVTQILNDGTEIEYKETPKLYWDDSDFAETNAYRWHHSKGSGRSPDNYESVIMYIPWAYREKVTFKVVYSMNNAALKYKDCSELYLSMYSGNTITKLKSYKAQILIPNKLMPEEYHTYTFGTANSRIPYIESDTINEGYHTFYIKLDENKLRFNYHNRYIEFCLLAYGKDKHIFTKYAPNNKYSNDNVLNECIEENEYYENENKKYNTYKGLILSASIIVGLIIVVSSIRKNRKIREKYTFYKPEMDFNFFREIPSDLDPIFASDLVFMKDPVSENSEKKEEYAAILLSLVRKQYITVSKRDENKKWNSYNTIIKLEPVTTEVETKETELENGQMQTITTSKTINPNTGFKLEELSTSERLYLELLRRHCNSETKSISIMMFQDKINHDYVHTNAFINDIEKKPILENGVMNGYFQDASYDKPKKELSKSAKTSLTFGIILLVIVNIISYFTPLSLCYGAYTILGIICIWNYFYLTIKSNNLILLTQHGVNEQAKWYGLYNFLNSDTLINEKEVHELPLWEKYLIYATAFGISEKVIKAIKIHAVELNVDNSLILNSRGIIHSSSFHSSARAVGRSIHTSSHGGGFGGHGYGGGGRGGGGGGGGH